MRTVELVIVGGGPAGLCAAKLALEAGLEVVIIDRADKLGGQLIKQTHKFLAPKLNMQKCVVLILLNFN